MVSFVNLFNVALEVYRPAEPLAARIERAHERPTVRTNVSLEAEANETTRQQAQD